MKKTLLVLLICFSAFSAFTQSRKIAGTVVSSDNKQPLGGATVTIKGTKTSTLTNDKGQFTFSVTNKVTALVVSHTGYLPSEVQLEGNSNFTIELISEVKDLDDVVVVGYGTVRKKDLTGTVASISASQLEKIPVSSAAEALTGRLPGVQVTTSDGEPGTAVTILVRGGTSVTGSNDPLYIVDGFRVNSINDIPPSDIESINVLKDAATTAIYGASGANGVIIVTTKSAKSSQKTIISYNSFVTGRKLARKLDVLSPYEYVLMQYEYAVLNKSLPDFTTRFGSYNDLELYKYQKGTDWQDELFGKMVYSQQQNLNISGGNEKTKVSLSLSYNKDAGQKPPNGLDRKYMSLKLNHAISKVIKLDFAMRYTNTNVNGAGTSGSSNFKIKDAITTRPVNGIADYLVFDPNLSDDDLYEQFRDDALRKGPNQLNQNDYRKRETKVLNFNIAPSWAITKDITWRSEFGYDFSWASSRRYYDSLTTTAKNNGGLPAIDLGNSYFNSYRITNTLNFANLLKSKKNNLGILLGQELFILGKGFDNTMQVIGFPLDMPVLKTFASLAQGTTLTNKSYDDPGSKVASFFGRAIYQYKERYIFNFTSRFDGSSKFAPGKQWGFFPAASAAWRISSEKFMDKVKFVSDLKLRVSYGIAGNNNIGDDLYRTLFSISQSAPYGVGNAPQPYYNYSSSKLANPDLRWETTITRNIGVDFELFAGKISGTIDAYHNTTKDLLVESKIPTSTGFSIQQQNIGQTSNRGIELSLISNLVSGKKFQLNANFNISFNKFNIDKLDGVNERNYNSGWASTDLRYADDYKVIVGQGVGLMYGFVADGMYTVDDFIQNGTGYTLKSGVPDSRGMNALGVTGLRPGVVKFKDLDGNGIIDINDRTVIGHGQPKSFGGFGLNAAYKGFDISTFFNFVTGNNVYNAAKIRFNMQYRTTYLNMLGTVNYDNRYHYIDAAGNLVTDLVELTKLNPNPSIWSPFSMGLTSPVVSSWAIEDGSFLRLNTISIGYTLPKKLTSKAYINKFRVYCTVYNAFLWTKYSGYDPEVNTLRNNGLTPGFDESAYPRSRNFTAGVNVTF